MRRFYIEIKNPENSEDKVQFRKLKKAKSIFVKKTKSCFVDPLLVPLKKVVNNTILDDIFFDIRKTNALGQRNN